MKLLHLAQVLLFSATLLPTGILQAQDEEPVKLPVGEPVVAAQAPNEWAGIVNIEVSFLFPDYREPWNAGQPSSGTGTGFLIGKNRFLTNAHVVSNGTRIIIRTSDDPKPHPARIVHIAHDCDLALIEAEDGTPFEKLQPMTFGGIPRLNTEVIAVGYPIGGDRMSVTRGVVSRIDFRPYSHTGVDSHLSIQVDAAINPGNSGGPVVQNGKVVGVAFQGLTGRTAQNVGYMIPVPVIRRFLKDIEDGHYDHYVDLAVSDFAIQNAAQRHALGLADDGIGVMIGDSEPQGSLGEILRPGDVLLAIDGNPVLNNGLVRIEGDLVNMNEIAERKYAGDTIEISYMREGKKQSASTKLKRFDPYVKLGSQYNQRPRYVVYAGLVFQPLDRNLVDAHQIRDSSVNYIFERYLTDKLYVQRPDPVVLTSILPDEVNTWIAPYAPGIVEEINGMPIKTLADVQTALSKKDKPFIEIRLHEKSRPLILKRVFAESAHPRIMQTYNIQEDHFLGKE
ncbi:MAG: trypsin-like peptidase domain-containing protein [Verrucomicrobiaceae bacterium]|nr:trypsin-like peptidase domain-containing protein [Verrucomicrobiaceae bacterium]